MARKIEMTMKAWRMTEAERLNVTPSCIANRLSKGKYPHLKIRHDSKRLVWVEVET